MLTVREVMRPEPMTLEPSETLREAVDALIAGGAGGAPVVANGRLVGVVSLSDILAFEAGTPGVPTFRPSDGEPGTDEIDDEKEAEEEGGRWFREMWNGAEADVVSRMASTDRPEWDELEEHSVDEVMTRKVIAISPDDAVEDAARVMDRAGLHRLIVMEVGTVVGVLSARDLVHAIAEGKLAPAQPLLPRPQPVAKSGEICTGACCAESPADRAERP